MYFESKYRVREEMFPGGWEGDVSKPKVNLMTIFPAKESWKSPELIINTVANKYSYCSLTRLVSGAYAAWM